MRSTRAAPASTAAASSHTIEIADNVDFNIGRKHAMRVGALFEGGTYRNFDARNAAGTFTFASIQAYQPEQPAAVHPAHRPGEHLVRATISSGSIGRTTSA